MVTDSFESNLQSMVDRCGSNVTYSKFVEAQVDALTKQLDNPEACYPSGEQKVLKAQIDMAPSPALRNKLGLSEDVAAVLLVTSKDLTALTITLTTKDRFTLPGYTENFYVDKVTPHMQSSGKYYAYYVALTRKAGGQRNR
ncbi:MAG: hypothetical protein WBP42_02600 [Candidatus Zixiibacteriota bacterium]